MPTIRGESFKPITPLSNAEIVSLCVPGTGNVAAQALQEKKFWDGSPTLFLFTHLGVDNRGINSCYLTALGSWQSDLIISPKRFCPAVDEETNIFIKKLELSQFKFDAHLVSQLIPLSSLDLTIVSGGNSVSWSEFLDFGGLEMCVRAHITPMTDYSAKLAIMLIPESLEELNNLTSYI